MHFLVIQRIGRAVDEPPAVGDGRPSPGLQKLDQARLTLFRHCTHAFRAQGTSMGKKLVGDFPFLVVPGNARCRFAMLAGEHLVAAQELFHL